MISLASYNSQQLERMQRDAMNRVSEMHRRSQQMVTGNSPREKEKPAPPVKQPSPTPVHNSAQSDLFGSLFGNSSKIKGLSNLWDFKIDEEKALIGIIIYILAKNNADPKLLIGLGYLLL